MGYPFNSLSSYAAGDDDNEPSDEYVKAQERKMKEQEERAKEWRKQRDLKMAEPQDVEPKRDEYTVMVAVKVSVPAGADIRSMYLDIPDNIIRNGADAFVGATMDDYNIDSVEPYSGDDA